MPKTTLKKIKTVISWTLGIPAAFLMFSWVEDLSLVWIQFVAMAVLFGVLAINGAFKQEKVYAK